MAIYTLIDGDCWIGIYENDSLVFQDRSVDADRLLKLLNHEKIEYFGRFECPLAWLDRKGFLPHSLSEVMMDYKGQDVPFHTYLEKTND